MEPTSPGAERITMQGRLDQAQQLRSDVLVSTQTFCHDSDNDLLNRIKLALFANFNWKFVQQEIRNLGPQSYEQLIAVEVPILNATGLSIKFNALHFVISRMDHPEDSMEGSVAQGQSSFDTVIALVEGAPSDELRRKMINTPSSLNGATPLHLVTASKFDKYFRRYLVEYLLRKGAIATTSDNQRRTPLHLAATNLCEESIRALLRHLEESDHTGTLYDINFKTPLDCAKDAWAQTHMTKVIGATATTGLSSSMAGTYERIMKLLDDYQKQKKGVPDPGSSNWSKYSSSNSQYLLSNIHILESPGPCLSVTGQVQEPPFWRMSEEPVTKVLHGPGTSSLLAELRCQTTDLFSRAGVQPAQAVVPVPGPRVTTSGPYVTAWIHLPAHNVRQLTFRSFFTLEVLVLLSASII